MAHIARPVGMAGGAESPFASLDGADVAGGAGTAAALSAASFSEAEAEGEAEWEVSGMADLRERRRNRVAAVVSPHATPLPEAERGAIDFVDAPMPNGNLASLAK